MELDESARRAAKVGEFQELAWLLRFELHPNVSGLQHEALLVDFLSFTAANSLGVAGKLGSFTVVSLMNRSAVSTKEQNLVTNWLLNRLEVHCINEADPYEHLSDAWLELLLVDEHAICNSAFDSFFR